MEIMEGKAYLDFEEVQATGLPNVIAVESYPEMQEEFGRLLQSADLSSEEVQKFIRISAIMGEIGVAYDESGVQAAEERKDARAGIIRKEKSFEITPREEKLSGYTNPILISKYDEFCVELERDIEEAQATLRSDDTHMGESYIEAKAWHEVLIQRTRLLDLMRREMTAEIADYYVDEVVAGFGGLLAESANQ